MSNEVVEAAPVEPRPRVLVVTGLSGAGKTQVAKILEDLDFFVIDNLPPTLLDKVVDLASTPGSAVGSMAIVADVRGRQFFGDLVDNVRDLRRAGADVQVIFLEASDEALVRRFEATRRRHPSAGGDGVLAGIAAEREVMGELRGMADLILDTTNTNVHELRDRVVGSLGHSEDTFLRIKVASFGFKYGSPRDADLVMDVRFLPNPHWVEELRPYNGKDAPVRDYVFGQPATPPFLDAFKHLLDVTVPGYVDEGKRHLTIAIGCTGGKHRSVAVAEEISRHLQATTDINVTLTHRDLGEE